jgi:hypothetical protein
VVSFVLLSGTKSLDFIIVTARNGYLVKLVLAVALTPVIYLGRGLFVRYMEQPAGARRTPIHPRPGIDRRRARRGGFRRARSHARRSPRRSDRVEHRRDRGALSPARHGPIWRAIAANSRE